MGWSLFSSVQRRRTFLLPGLFGLIGVTFCYYYFVFESPRMSLLSTLDKTIKREQKHVRIDYNSDLDRICDQVRQLGIEDRAISVILPLLNSSDEVTSSYARYAIWQLGRSTPEADKALIATYHDPSQSMEARKEAAYILMQISPEVGRANHANEVVEHLQEHD
jgi:hypothetical protein